jgi:mono/diheme cytochrome c family protein
MRCCAALAVVAAVATVCPAVPQMVSQTVPQAGCGTVSETACSTRTIEAKGEPAYAKHCESCHGRRAGGGQAPALVPFTLELSELIAIVRQGIGVMRGIPRDQVSDEEISAIRDYLIRVGK